MKLAIAGWGLVWLGVGWLASARAGEIAASGHLVAETDAIRPATPFGVGLLITLPEGWHTYWLNPGDSGMPPAVEWKLPEGFAAGPLCFPAPYRSGDPPEVTFGYERQVLVFSVIRPPANLATGRTYALRAHATWLICNHECVPQAADLECVLPSGEGPAVAANPALFAQARQALPVDDPAWTVRASAEGSAVRLLVQPPSDAAPIEPASCYFFPAERNRIAYGPQTWKRDGRALRVELERTGDANAAPDRLRGVLVVRNRAGGLDKALAVEVPLTAR